MRAVTARGDPLRRNIRRLRSAVVGPDRDRATDDRIEREWAEIPAVETVSRVPVHEEDFTIGNDAAALPAGQRSAATVMIERTSKGHAIDDDGAASPAHRRASECQHMLQQRHAVRQVFALGKQVRQRLGRHDDGDI